MAEDEIGNLANTFNLMTSAIEERTKNLEKTAEDLKQSEHFLRLEHNRLRTVVNSMTDGLILLDSKNQVELLNKAAEPVADILTTNDLMFTIRKC